MLDWIWLGYDVEGQPRDWEVLYGLALARVSDDVLRSLAANRKSNRSSRKTKGYNWNFA